MGLQQRKRRFKASVPEAVGMALLAVVLCAAALWLRASPRPDWQQTAARVVYCDLFNRAYSNSALPDQVHLTYQYTAFGRTYTDSWEGFWPQGQSPNALPVQELGVLREKGYPLSISFDPLNPAKNMLHYTGAFNTAGYKRITIIAFLVMIVYLVKVYPAWKYRS